MKIFKILIIFNLCVLGNKIHALKVLTTIKPIHSLVSCIMHGVGTPDLLLAQNDDPHSFSLELSHLKKINNSDLIIWIGEKFESFLPKKIVKDKGVTLIQISKLNLIRLGKNKYDRNCEYCDPHIWLDLDNAIQIIKHVANELGKTDPINEVKYNINAKKTIKKIEELKELFNSSNIEKANIKFVALHNAYNYFEDNYKLTNIAKKNISHSCNHLSIKGYKKIKKEVIDHKINFIFVEPQRLNVIEEQLINQCNLEKIEIDPLGININSGEDHYFSLMKTICQQFQLMMKKKINIAK